MIVVGKEALGRKIRVDLAMHPVMFNLTGNKFDDAKNLRETSELNALVEMALEDPLAAGLMDRSGRNQFCRAVVEQALNTQDCKAVLIDLPGYIEVGLVRKLEEHGFRVFHPVIDENDNFVGALSY